MPKKQVQKSILSHLFIIFATGMCLIERHRESILKEI